MSEKKAKFTRKTDADRFRWCFLHPKYSPLWFGFGLSLLMTLLPYPLIIRLGRPLGRFLKRRTPKRVHITRVNLKKCFPEMAESDREVLLNSSFENIGIGVLEAAMAWWWPSWRLKRLVRFKGMENLECDQGVILLALHFTTIELAGRLVAMRHSIDAIYREHRNPVYEYMQRRQRLKYDPDGLLLRRRDVRGMLQSLRSGRAIWYAPDQDYGIKQGVFVPFFGIPAATVTATSRYAALGRARVVPVTAQRLPGSMGYEIQFWPVWEGYPTNDLLGDTIRVNAFAEARVREAPENYLWLHRRFKNRPEGEKDFYR